MLQIVRVKKLFVHLILFGLISFIVPADAENTGLEDGLVRLHLVTEKQALRQALLNVETELAFRFHKNVPSGISDISRIQHTIAKLNFTLADEIDSLRHGGLTFLSGTAPEKKDVNDQNAIMSQRWALLRVWFTRLYLSADEFSRDRMLEYYLSDAMLSFSDENYYLAARQFRFILLAFEEEFTGLDGAYFYAAESNLVLGYFNEAGFLFKKLMTTYPKSFFYPTSVKRILQMSAFLNRPESLEKYVSENDNSTQFAAESMALLRGVFCLNAGDLMRALKYFRQIPSDSPDYDVAQQQIMWLEYARTLEPGLPATAKSLHDFLTAISAWHCNDFVAAENQFRQIILKLSHPVDSLAAEIIADYCHLQQIQPANPALTEMALKDISPLLLIADRSENVTGLKAPDSVITNEPKNYILDILEVRGLNPVYQYLFQQLCRQPFHVTVNKKDRFSEIELHWQQKLKSAKLLNRGNGRFQLPETDALIQLRLALLRLLRNERARYRLSATLLEKYTIQSDGFQFEQLCFNFDQIENLSINRQQLLENIDLIVEHFLKKQRQLETELCHYDKRIRSVQEKIQTEQWVMEKQERQVYFDNIYFNEALDSSRAGSRLKGSSGNVTGKQSPFFCSTLPDSVEVKK